MDKKPFDHSFQYKDAPHVMETFADGVHQVQVDATTARMTLTVSRADPPKPGNKMPTGQKVAVARIVLSLPAMAELYNQLNSMIHLLEQQGLMRRDGSEARSLQ